VRRGVEGDMERRRWGRVKQRRAKVLG